MACATTRDWMYAKAQYETLTGSPTMARLPAGKHGSSGIKCLNKGRTRRRLVVRVVEEGLEEISSVRRNGIRTS